MSAPDAPKDESELARLVIVNAVYLAQVAAGVPPGKREELAPEVAKWAAVREDGTVYVVDDGGVERKGVDLASVASAVYLDHRKRRHAENLRHFLND